MLQAGVLAAMVFFGYYNVWWIGVLSLAQGIINTFDVTARQSLMVELVDNKGDLPNAIELNSSAFNAARMGGQALEIARASCRARGGQTEVISGGRGALKKKK